MDAENQISLLVDRLASGEREKELEKNLFFARTSCKALGKDLGQSRQRVMRFHRALTWLAQSPTVRLAEGTPAWVSKTLNSAMVNDRHPLDNPQGVANG
ncbi:MULTISPECIES: hypothetical protein [Pseudomonas]|uniref:hypothetical protein n=1 Tax=Pseudomonas TaxID=286 RepID=UPI000761D5F5|nr:MULTISPECIES: hypothetical protein [Pseudomonas]MDG9809494.1 hypothetical protein [Pseudomonas juntendi]MDG9815740.1 hypothetical protein [Pseudomonas putida]